MTEGARKILVTGGAGFIGSHLVHYLIRETLHQVLTVDALTYAGNREALADVLNHPRHNLLHANILDKSAMAAALAQFQPDVICHLAAETHVDRSIAGPSAFIETNVVGTSTLLQAVLDWWRPLPDFTRNAFRFHQISTDEVFGSLGEEGTFTEDSPYAPRSPYAASKAASDHLVRAFHHTYGLPVLISHCSNNYGPGQYPEKLIPLLITRALRGDPLPIYGDGRNSRDWLSVEDHVRALVLVFSQGRVGESYAIGGGTELRNLALAQALCAVLDAYHPRPDGAPHASAITFVPDRLGHDWRYALNAHKIHAELGWSPHIPFADGLRETVLSFLKKASLDTPYQRDQ
jgi:dTDP-glucose 4,6-dehydratase